MTVFLLRVLSLLCLVVASAATSETTDGNALCDYWGTLSSTNQAKLTNWCGAKSGDSYVNGPCTGTWLGVTCTTNRVTYLTVNGFTGLGGSLPTSIGGLNALIFINLASAGITGSIPSSMGALTGLTILALSDNSLSGSIPSSMGALTGLTSLVLASNALTGPMPASFCSL